eukprot:CAMPEP_0177371890 /NCGR_PEP_ID=MMETSP0368-20130122/42763_1 /TAXON_ID=447022 ORGANISM="Scrippsiella hangoei-like, Strain SHHI-4" /NCGR_SAMPLE_ID=MMETSP0368 /ASSEMBLY_ACC=CAM_ASM_000363 /LENGTH=73 /DNA_ID=CAMNT_0018835245 /DNA_START=38 /DNA_END=254 /DNA_ORIENTATION=+
MPSQHRAQPGLAAQAAALSAGRAAASAEVSAEASATSSSFDSTAKHSCSASSSWPLSPSSFSAEALAAARRAS